MGFSTAEKEQMLALHGVGATVIARLEQIGFSSLDELVDADVAAVTKTISEMMRSSCWHNSPQARGAISTIVDLAQSRTS